jgi:hypothetical protein
MLAARVTLQANGFLSRVCTLLLGGTTGVPILQRAGKNRFISH